MNDLVRREIIKSQNNSYDKIINYEEIKEKLRKYHPRVLIVGASAYSRIIDFERIRNIVDKYNEFIWKYAFNVYY